MLYFITALYAEAKPIITHLSLRKNNDYIHSTVYENEHVTLLITGIGKLSAAIALTELLTRKPPAKQDILCNIGIVACAEQEKQNQLFFCNSITDACTERTFYPDLLFSVPCNTASLITVDHILTAEQLTTLHNPSSTNLYPLLDEVKQFSTTPNTFANKKNN